MPGIRKIGINTKLFGQGGGDIFGPEMFVETSGFTNPNWVEGAQFTFVGGNIVYDDTANGTIYCINQVGDLLVDEVVRIQVTIDIAAGNAQMALSNSGGAGILDIGAQLFVDGFNEVEGTVTLATVNGFVGFRVFNGGSTSAFDITALSLKRFL